MVDYIPLKEVKVENERLRERLRADCQVAVFEDVNLSICSNRYRTSRASMTHV
jgi:hypothetical protein